MAPWMWRLYRSGAHAVVSGHLLNNTRAPSMGVLPEVQVLPQAEWLRHRLGAIQLKSNRKVILFNTIVKFPIDRELL